MLGKIFFAGLTILAFTAVSAQNIGIGITNPIKAKLEVATTSTTTGLFGSTGTGVSLQQNWPTIGFNQYTNASGISSFIGTGYAANTFLDPGTGSLYFRMFNSGLPNNATNAGTVALTISNNGTSTFRDLEVQGTTSIGCATMNFSTAVVSGILKFGNRSYVRIVNDIGSFPAITDFDPGSKLGQILVVENVSGGDFYINHTGIVSMPIGFWTSTSDIVTFLWNGSVWKMISKVDF